MFFEIITPMAYTYLSLRRKLSDKLHEDDLFEILYEAQGVEDNPMKRNLYRLLFDEDKRVSDNAAWIFAHFDLHTNQWLYGKHDELVDEAMRTNSSTKRRLLLSVLLRQPFVAATFRTDFLDFCLNRMISVSEPVAIRVLCLKLAYEQSLFFPEFLAELRNTLEIMEPELLQAGLKTARRNVLKQILSLLDKR